MTNDENKIREAVENEFHGEFGTQLTNQIFMALSNTVEAKDRYTNGHSQRVASYAKEIAKRMGCDEQQQQEVYFAGLLHDVGKIRVPNTIINKNGPLNEAEFAEMKLHTLVGYYILKEVSAISDFAVAARWHHERWDGKGYPNGLEGENIPFICRIIGVADAYDAMTSQRSYQIPKPHSVVREEFAKGSGTQFDPEIAAIMLQMIDEDVDYKMKQPSPPKSYTVLAVDDEPSVLKWLQFVLGREAIYKIIPASGVDQAIQILQKTDDVSLVLLDVEMPKKDGFVALEWIRKHKDNMPVIFMTGDKEMEIIQKAERMGISDYLTKPLVPQMLLESIRNVLSIYRNWHA